MRPLRKFSTALRDDRGGEGPATARVVLYTNHPASDLIHATIASAPALARHVTVDVVRAASRVDDEAALLRDALAFAPRAALADGTTVRGTSRVLDALADLLVALERSGDEPTRTRRGPARPARGVLLDPDP